MPPRIFLKANNETSSFAVSCTPLNNALVAEAILTVAVVLVYFDPPLIKESKELADDWLQFLRRQVNTCKPCSACKRCQ